MARAAVLGCSSTRLTRSERAFFQQADPLGFILFARNCDTPDQIAALTAELRESVGRADAPVLIDQEGGRVQRLKPPIWRQAPTPAAFGRLAQRDAAAGRRAAWLNARLLAHEVGQLGITVDCTPCLDLAVPGASGVIGDRAFAGDPARVGELGRAVCEGLLAGGVLPTIKHIPGHGRALVDSHYELPRVDTDLETLRAYDVQPFAALADQAWAMTAHVVYTALDPDRPATTSPIVVDRIMRTEIGFDGVLLSDDLSMKALSGGFTDRAADAIAAGCDIVLHCNGDRREMDAVMAGVPELAGDALRRVRAGEAARTARVGPVDPAETAAQLDALMAGA